MNPNADTDKFLIEDLIEQQRAAWNAGDAKGFSEGFLPDGCFVNILGALTYGREPFEAQHAKIFATIYKGSHIELPIRRLHFLRPDIAIVDIDAELSQCTHLPPGITLNPDGVLQTRLQEIMSKEQGTWRVASFHNVVVKTL